MLSVLLYTVLAWPAAAATLNVANQKELLHALCNAAHALDGAPYSIAWSEFPAAAPLLEALNAGAVDAGVAGTRLLSLPTRPARPSAPCWRCAHRRRTPWPCWFQANPAYRRLPTYTAV